MSKQPNILILMPDQMRADCLSCGGHPMIHTPHIDRIAAEGMHFTDATTNSPICMPARASFISGRYVHNHGMWTNRGELPETDLTFFHLLQQAGYHTAHVGKSHYYMHTKFHMRNREDYMHARGFTSVHETTGPHATCTTESYMTDRWKELGLYDTFLADYARRNESRRGPNPIHLTDPCPLPTEEFMDSYVGRTAAEFVQNYKDNDPMCLFVGFPGPHEPWDAPDEYATMYDPKSTPDPIPISSKLGELPEEIGGKSDFQEIAGLDTDTIQRIRANYYGKISCIDHWVGEILKAYEARGWLDDLNIIFWSDHGEMAGDHGRLYKGTFHETSVRVPMIARSPGRIPAGGKSNALVETVDIAATALDMAGLEPSRRILGTSLISVADDPCSLERDGQISSITSPIQNTMLRTRTHKYVVDETGMGYMLYDLEKDPDEQNNLIADPTTSDLQKDLRERLLNRLLASQDCMV